MKKLVLLAAMFLLVSATVMAQGGPGADPAAMMQRMKERVKPQLIDKTKISDAEAEKVLEINFAAQRQRREIRMDNALGEEEKAKKTAALDEETAKKYKAIPLQDEQVKAVVAFFEEMRNNRPQRRNNQ